MGYRKLLKQYMDHIEGLIGTDLVEMAPLAGTLDKRSIGELRALAAERSRERQSNEMLNPYAAAVKGMLYNGEISIEQLASVEGIEADSDDEPMAVETFQRLLRTMLYLATPEAASSESAQ